MYDKGVYDRVCGPEEYAAATRGRPAPFFRALRSPPSSLAPPPEQHLVRNPEDKCKRFQQSTDPGISVSRPARSAFAGQRQPTDLREASSHPREETASDAGYVDCSTAIKVKHSPAVFLSLAAETRIGSHHQDRTRSDCLCRHRNPSGTAKHCCNPLECPVPVCQAKNAQDQDETEPHQ